jgi:predicted GNAT family N-acyltransferase
MSTKKIDIVLLQGDWKTLEKYCFPIRFKVFVEEQNVPADMELDEYDPICLHVLACVKNNKNKKQQEEKEEGSPNVDQESQNSNDSLKTNLERLENGELIPAGTGRLALEKGKIGRMAVHSEFRGTGIGAVILNELIRQAKISGVVKECVLNAQIQAKQFYERSGFKVASDEFDEAGIPHVKMTLTF